METVASGNQVGGGGEEFFALRKEIEGKGGCLRSFSHPTFIPTSFFPRQKSFYLSHLCLKMGIQSYLNATRNNRLNTEG